MRLLVLTTVLLLAVCGQGQEVVEVEGEVDGQPIWFHYEDILKDPDQMNKLVECVEDQTKCSETLLQVRGVIQDYYQTNCRRCCNLKRSMIRSILEYFAQVDSSVPTRMKNKFELQ